MAWFLIVVLAVALLTALVAVLVMVPFGDDREAERARIESEVRRAERRLHAIARDSFAAMLDEARSHERR